MLLRRWLFMQLLMRVRVWRVLVLVRRVRVLMIWRRRGRRWMVGLLGGRPLLRRSLVLMRRWVRGRRLLITGSITAAAAADATMVCALVLSPCAWMRPRDRRVLRVGMLMHWRGVMLRRSFFVVVMLRRRSRRVWRWSSIARRRGVARRWARRPGSICLGIRRPGLPVGVSAAAAAAALLLRRLMVVLGVAWWPRLRVRRRLVLRGTLIAFVRCISVAIRLVAMRTAVRRVARVLGLSDRVLMRRAALIVLVVIVLATPATFTRRGILTV